MSSRIVKGVKLTRTQFQLSELLQRVFWYRIRQINNRKRYSVEYAETELSPKTEGTDITSTMMQSLLSKGILEKDRDDNYVLTFAPVKKAVTFSRAMTRTECVHWLQKNKHSFLENVITCHHSKPTTKLRGAIALLRSGKTVKIGNSIDDLLVNGNLVSWSMLETVGKQTARTHRKLHKRNK